MTKSIYIYSGSHFVDRLTEFAKQHGYISYNRKLLKSLIHYTL